MLLTTVNASRSAFLSISLKSTFFDSIRIVTVSANANAADGGGDPAYATCSRINLKPLINVFKHGMDNVERCWLKLKCAPGSLDRLVVHFVCKHGKKKHLVEDQISETIHLYIYIGIVKTHKLTFEECLPSHAVYNKFSCKHSFSISPKAVQDWLAHFHKKLDEVSLVCNKKGMKIKVSNNMREGREAGGGRQGSRK